MSSRICLVYALVDPRTGRRRYVGKSTKGIIRPREHIRHPGKTTGPYCARWLNELIRAGIEYTIEILEYCTRETLSDRERFWIAFGRASGWPLTNLTDGGEGTLGRVKSEEERKAISRASRGRTHSAETRALISNFHTMRMKDPALRKHLSEKSVAAWADPEKSIAMRAAFNRPGVREKIRESKLGDKNASKRPEVKARISDTMMRPSKRRENSELRRLDWTKPERLASMLGENNIAKRPEVRAKLAGQNNPMSIPNRRRRDLRRFMKDNCL